MCLRRVRGAASYLLLRGRVSLHGGESKDIYLIHYVSNQSKCIVSLLFTGFLFS